MKKHIELTGKNSDFTSTITAVVNKKGVYSFLEITDCLTKIRLHEDRSIEDKTKRRKDLVKKLKRLVKFINSYIKNLEKTIKEE